MIDIIGNLYTPSVLDDEGNIITESILQEGFHINSTQKLVGLNSYLVNPATPRRTFAGVETLFYTFESEEKARELLNYNEEFGYQPEFEETREVPLKIPAVDGLLLLDAMGLLDKVEEYINSAQATRAEKIIYQRELNWYKNDALVQGLGRMLGLSNTQIDELFIQASQTKR